VKICAMAELIVIFYTKTKEAQILVKIIINYVFVFFLFSCFKVAILQTC